MHGHRNRTAGLVLTVLALAACGGEEEPRGMAIAFATEALFAESTQVAIYFYTGEITCDEIRATLPHPQSVLGPYTAPVGEEARSRGVTFTLDDVPVNTYVVFVDALDASGTIVGSGCSPAQQVFEGEVSRIRVKIS
jgi:hypothetical protein